MANVIPAASAEFETAGSTGNFIAWFGCTVAQSTLQALNGTGSMEITATDASIGIQQDNWPGFPITGGQDFGISISGWKANPARTITVDFDWRNESGTSQQIDTLSLGVGGSAWATQSATVAAPGTATRLFITASWAGNASDVVYLDAIEADDAPTGGAVNVTISATLPGLTSSLAGTVEVDGALTGTLPALTASAAAAVEVDSTLSVTLPALTASATAEALVDADISGSLPALSASFTATQDNEASATISATLPGLTGSLTSEAVVDADIAGLLPTLLTSFTAQEPSSIVGYTIGDDITGIARVARVIVGPASQRLATGPARARTLSGPDMATEDLNGPDSVNAPTPGGLALSRTATGPTLARTITGPEV